MCDVYWRSPPPPLRPVSHLELPSHLAPSRDRQLLGFAWRSPKMTPRMRMMALARALARRSVNRVPKGIDLLKSDGRKARGCFEAGVQKKIYEQNLRIKDAEEEKRLLEDKFDKETKLYKSNQKAQEEMIDKAVKGLRYSFMKGALSVVLVAGICYSAMVSMDLAPPGNEILGNITTDGTVMSDVAKREA